MIPEINIPLSVSPANRWKLTDQQAQWASWLIQGMVSEVGGVKPYRQMIEAYAQEHVSSEICEELELLAKLTGTDFIEALAANMYYDFIKMMLGCTAFAVNTEHGPIHARNMDWFSYSNYLSQLTTILNYVESSGRSSSPCLASDKADDRHVRFRVVGWPGQVGVLSAIVPGRFTVTLNAVLSEEPMQFATSTAFMIREVCQRAENFEQAVEQFSKWQITSDCLLLVTGTQWGEMVIVERTPTQYALQTTDGDYLVVTNDYRESSFTNVESSGEIYETTCSRFNAADSCLNKSLPTNSDECFAILNHDKVRMQITVQQMVMCAATGMLEVRTAHS